MKFLYFGTVCDLNEYEKCYTDKETLKKVRPMTLEGCVVRISDIIGYIGRDIEDAIKLGVLTREEVPDNIRQVLGTTNKEIVNSIKEEDNGINIYIGSESEISDETSIIKTKYNIGGEEGTIAIIGPKRMEYDRVVNMLEFIKENIEKESRNNNE